MSSESFLLAPACFGVSVCFEAESKLCAMCSFQKDCFSACIAEASAIIEVAGQDCKFLKDRLVRSKTEKIFEVSLSTCRNKKARKIIMHYRDNGSVSFDDRPTLRDFTQGSKYPFIKKVAEFLMQNSGVTSQELELFVKSSVVVSEKTSADYTKQAIEFFRSFGIIKIENNRIIVL